MEITTTKEELEKLINDRVREAVDIARDAVVLAEMETNILFVSHEFIDSPTCSYYFQNKQFNRSNWLEAVAGSIEDRNHRRKVIKSRLEKLSIIL